MVRILKALVIVTVLSTIALITGGFVTTGFASTMAEFIAAAIIRRYIQGVLQIDVTIDDW